MSPIKGSHAPCGGPISHFRGSRVPYGVSCPLLRGLMPPVGVPYVILRGLVSPVGSHVPCEGSMSPMGCPAKAACPLWGSPVPYGGPCISQGGLISPTGGSCALSTGSHAPRGGPTSPIRGSYVPYGFSNVQRTELTRTRVTSVETALF